jgi:RNA polymerase sigma-70 factor (ECF subfamily)
VSADPEKTDAPKPEHASDTALMDQVARGNFGALEEIVNRHQKFAWSLAYRFTGDAAEAEDIVQEVFLRLLKASPGYRPTAGFRTYFSRIVVHLCLDYRSKKRPVYREVLPEVTDDALDPESALRQTEDARALADALHQLLPQQRMVLVLRHLENLNYSTIAELMGITAKAVDSLLQRARQALRRNLESRS